MLHRVVWWCSESRYLLTFILFLCDRSSICTNLFLCIQIWNKLHWQREWLLLIWWYWDGSFFLALSLRTVEGTLTMFRISFLVAWWQLFLLWLCFMLFRHFRKCPSPAFLWFGIFTWDLNNHLQFLISIHMGWLPFKKYVCLK